MYGIEIPHLEPCPPQKYASLASFDMVGLEHKMVDENLVNKLTQEVLQRIKTGGSPAPTSGTSIVITDPSQVAPYIDHTLLKPEATAAQIKTLCEEAAAYHFATVCVNSSHVRLAAELLRGTSVKAIAVVGFPLGATTAKAKAFETLEAIRNGAQEIDTVINIGALKSKDYKLVCDDIRAVVEAASPTPVKVILETSQINDEEKVVACALSVAAGAAFVKTSTGFAGGGATIDDVKLMRRVVGPNIGVKASGGIRDYETAKQMLLAGANRLGTSSSVGIVTGAKENKSKGY